MPEIDFYKESEEDKVWWVETPDRVGEMLFSFDKKKIYNLFKDFPQNLSKEEVKIFCQENPKWAEYFGISI